ncbi:thiol reductant ABC exporter subunit CydD [Salisediminibacterium halotolerans]|uniref:thiol reductant ABC exporter subunit CydD n=1 Tax=Salisediminibacterium halotolerans TaxID=517425 RepID=UPI000EAB807D|nr:thiol reductant ABC exporter subunit CydD [Salisediminibacterium halotolerans]RLJ71743.1 ATP-binding cassette subfamily C protein CydD [Actinophytocola xinjiangensis]RPE86893.1 ATP-binding cassette subfamily C protein CydD [Salisediminibacterium halotolerans]TWG32956.1 ATP-binding cassette subfamily C protein CydD [Salisediminibacterium halotolerans]GEL09099.1 thiol reductant ABC exporter subunit CydD [Salisediminibacterium halotolerans]
MKALKEIAKAQTKERAILIAGSLLMGITIVAMAYFIVAVVDLVFLQGASFHETTGYLFGLAAVLLLRALLTYLNGRTGIYMAAKIKARFRKNLADTYRKNPLETAITGQTGEKVSVYVDAVDDIDGYFRNYYPQLMQSSVVPLVLLGAIFYANWISGLIILVTAPFIPIAMIVVGKNAEKKSEEQMEELNRFSGTFLDILQGLATLKFFGRSKEKADVLEKSSLAYRDQTMGVLRVAFLTSLMLEFISMLSIAIVALEVGLRLVIYDQLSFFTAFFVLILTPEFFASLKELGTAFHNGKASTGAAERVMGELNKDDKEPQRAKKDVQYRIESKDTPPEITLEAVRFSYRDDSAVIKGVDAVIPSGSQTAVIGPSGAGKTTVLNLLAGLAQPDEGTVSVNGVDLQAIYEEDWFRQISYITQEPYIFSGTIRENAVIGMDADVSGPELEEAVEKAGMRPVIEELPDGFATVVGEGGRQLSGGEKQRLALVRAFLKKPSVILFDEPTVGLDLRTERILRRSIEELSQGATMITVAHRLHTIRHADQLLYLEGGILQGQGTHEELLAKLPAYQEMVRVHRGGAQQ